MQNRGLQPKHFSVAQVGEFYETQGTDAVVLIQWAGLNPMGRSSPPRAGLPVVNLRRTLDDLVQGAGLSVVRCRICFRVFRVHAGRLMQGAGLSVVRAARL